MTKKILATWVVTAAMLIGCGGSNDPETATTGKAFYIDAAVGGVKYKCGTQEDITGADGSFTFDLGSGCTFYLGDIKLRDVVSSDLEDGKKLYETDVKIARILQSLDKDGNPDNGITIEADIIKALADNDITSLPTTEAEVEFLFNVIANNGGTKVSEEDAEKHLDEVRLKALLSAKTIYVPYNMDGTDIVEKIVFNSTANSATWEQVYGKSNSGTMQITISGSTFTTITEEGSEGHEVLKVTDTYIEIKNSAEGDTQKVYFSLEDAKASFGGGGSSAPTQGLEALIVGKTYYLTDEEETGVQTIVFSDDGTGTFGVHPFSYVISGDNLIITGEDGENTFTNVDELSDYLRFTDANGNETGRFFFTYEAAEATL